MAIVLALVLRISTKEMDGILLSHELYQIMCWGRGAADTTLAPLPLPASWLAPEPLLLPSPISSSSSPTATEAEAPPPSHTEHQSTPTHRKAGRRPLPLPFRRWRAGLTSAAGQMAGCTAGSRKEAGSTPVSSSVCSKSKASASAVTPSSPPGSALLLLNCSSQGARPEQAVNAPKL